MASVTGLLPRLGRPAISAPPPTIQNMMKPRNASSEPSRSPAWGRIVDADCASELVSALVVDAAAVDMGSSQQADSIALWHGTKPFRPVLSRPSEKFLIEPSRKFLLTAVRQKDGTNRDEPRGTRLVGLVEASQRREDDAAGSGGADGGE